MPGFLKGCADRHIPVVIVSNKGLDPIATFLERQGWEHLITRIIARDPAVVIDAMDELLLPPSSHGRG